MAAGQQWNTNGTLMVHWWNTNPKNWQAEDADKASIRCNKIRRRRVENRGFLFRLHLIIPTYASWQAEQQLVWHFQCELQELFLRKPWNLKKSWFFLYFQIKKQKMFKKQSMVFRKYGGTFRKYGGTFDYFLNIFCFFNWKYWKF